VAPPPGEHDTRPAPAQGDTLAADADEFGLSDLTVAEAVATVELVAVATPPPGGDPTPPAEGHPQKSAAENAPGTGPAAVADEVPVPREELPQPRSETARTLTTEAEGRGAGERGTTGGRPAPEETLRAHVLQQLTEQRGTEPARPTGSSSTPEDIVSTEFNPPDQQAFDGPPDRSKGAASADAAARPDPSGDDSSSNRKRRMRKGQSGARTFSDGLSPSRRDRLLDL
jgi:hypothetical protein